MTRTAALRYSLAPACIAAAVLLHLSPAGPFLHPTGLFVCAVIAAAWFGGAGPGFLAAVLATFALPQLIAMSYPLVAGFFDLPRFITFAVTGLAVGWGATRRSRAEAALREMRNDLEAKVTERTRAVQASEERYARAMAAADDGLWEWNPATDEMFASPRARRLWAIADGVEFRTRAELVAHGGIHPEDRPRIEETIAASLAGRSAGFEIEYRVVDPAGELRWIRSRGKVFPGAQGEPARLTGALTDITERKRAGEALRLSEERYALAMQASGEGHWDWKIGTDEFYASPRWREISGFAPDEKIGTRAQMLARYPFHPEDRPKYEAAVAAHFAGTTPRLDLELRITPHGRLRWVKFTGMCLRDAAGVPVRYAGSIMDVTEQKRAEEALRESEQRYERAMEATEAGHWEWDLVTHQVFHSPRFRELYGVSPEEKFADRDAWKARQPVSGAERARQEQALQAAIADPAKRYDIELSFELRPGEVRWLRSRGKVFRDADGRPLRIAGATTDITARKRAEEALRLSEERYALAMEAAQDAHWDWIVGTDQYYTSPRVVDVFGLPPGTTFTSRQDYLAKTPLLKEDLDVWLRAARELFAGTGSRLSMELRAMINGEIHWIQHNGVALRDASGRVVRWCGSVRDTTARRRAEEAVRLSEKRYALAMEVAEEGHFDWDVQTDEMFASPQALRVVGAPPEAKYRTRSDVMAHVRYHPDDDERVRKEWRAALDGRGVEHEFEYRVMRGEEPRWVRGRWKVFRDEAGVASRVIGVVTDITERKLAADELRESEARFRSLTEVSSDWYWRQDENLRFTYSSAAINPPADYPGGSSIGKTRRELPGIVPLSSSWAEHDALLAARKPFRDFEYSRPAADGTMRYVSTSGAPIFDEHGRFKGYQGIGRSITGRKRMEEELRESEARFRALTELSSDWYWEQDENLRFTYLSNQAAQLTGYSGESSLGKTRWEIANMAPLTCSWAEHQAVLAARQPFRDLECRRIGPDGTVRYLSMSGAPIFDAQGRFHGYRGIGRNITQRKRAEAELRESEARFRALTELSSDWYWRQDENMRFSYLSHQGLDATGLAGGAVLGRPRWDFDNVKPMSGSWAEHQAVLAARQPFRDLELIANAPDGTVSYLSISGAPIFDEQGKFGGYQGVARNITERKRIEEELRARQEMLELAQKAAQAIAFEWRLGADGPDRNRWSPELAAMYGIAPEAYDGSLEQWKKLVHPEDWAAVKAAIRHAQQTGEVSAQYRVVHPDGSVHWLHAKGRMFFDAERKPVRMVGFMHDVTQRRHAEEELRRMERQLRQAQRLEAMGTLAGGIAHDFNNILGAILGYGEMALRDAPKGSRLARDLDSIVVAGERGRALVDRVLAFSRSGVGERVPVHVEKVVREALDLISAQLPPNVTLHAKLHSGRAAMLGDATQVHQVLMNLSTNAIQAMPSSGTLRVLLDAVSIEAARVPTIGRLAPGEYVVLQVADTGTGIAPEILDRIFDPFFTTKEVGTGTGLGLSLVHGIVAELGGAIDVASTPGAGSTFTVYLPRSGDALDSSQREEPELPRGEGQRVLIVDDEEPLVRLATRTLEELGYAPVGFTSSTAALAAFRADPQRFDALITDERMPGMSGSALIREVRGIRHRMPIVLMSGYVGGKVTSGAREAGAAEVLKKPLSARELAASLARVLHP